MPDIRWCCADFVAETRDRRFDFVAPANAPGTLLRDLADEVSYDPMEYLDRGIVHNEPIDFECYPCDPHDVLLVPEKDGYARRGREAYLARTRGRQRLTGEYVPEQWTGLPREQHWEWVRDRRPEWAGADED